MEEIDKYREDIINFITNELKTLKEFNILLVDSYGNQDGQTQQINIYFCNKIIAYININEYFEKNKFDFEFHSNTLHQNFVKKDIDSFKNNLKNIIDLYKKFKYPTHTIKDYDTIIIQYLTDPIFNIDYYNEFVDYIITNSPYLIKYVNIKLLNNNITNKYNYLINANNFDII